MIPRRTPLLGVRAIAAPVAGLLPVRLPPDRWYPAGDPVAVARMLPLASGGTVRVVEAGPADGAPVLLLHGWACSAYSFRHQIPALAAAGFRAVAVDLKGHGLSARPTAAGEYTPGAMVAWALEVVDALGAPCVALVGHSMGGGIATRLALEAPDRVARLGLVSAVGFGTVPFLPAATHLPSLLVERPIQRFAPRWLWHLVLHGVTGRLRPYAPRDIDEYWAPTQFPEFPLVLWRLVRSFGWTPLRPDERERLHVPLLTIYGGRDRVVRRAAEPAEAAAESVASADAGSRVAIIADAGHAAQEEAPDEVNRLLLEFLRPWAAEHRPERGGEEDAVRDEPRRGGGAAGR